MVLDETKFKTDPVIAVTDALTKQFDGQAQAVAEGPLGALAKLKNLYSDLMETIGGVVAGPMTDFMNKLSDMMVKLMESKETIQTLTDVFFYLGETIMNVLTFTGELIGTWVAGIVSNFEVITLLLSGDFAGAMEQFRSMNETALNSVGESWNKLVATQKSAYAKINAERQADVKNDATAKAQTQKQQKEHFAWQNAEQTKQDTKEKADDEKKKKEEVERQVLANQQKMADLQSTLGTISTLTTSHNKALFVVGKAAAISNAIINTALGVARALGSAPPPVNIALAAMVAAAGAAQIHTIGATSMAEGGIVMPTSGGTLARIGEAGYPEAVIPLDDDRADSIMGNNITININAGTVVADDNSLRDFAEMIDEKLYSLKKGNQTIAI